LEDINILAGDILNVLCIAFGRMGYA